MSKVEYAGPGLMFFVRLCVQHMNRSKKMQFPKSDKKCGWCGQTEGMTHNPVCKFVGTVYESHTKPEVAAAYSTARRKFDLQNYSNDDLVAELTARGGRAFTLEHIGEVSAARCARWHEGGVDGWSPEKWITAIVGELGEMANNTKKLFRIRDGMIGSPKSVEELEKEEAWEWADTMLYMILFAVARKINMTATLIQVFNAKSEQLGFDERL